MATITRTNLFRAIEESSDAFLSTEARHRLNYWAYDAKEFNLGDWDNCPLDQVGLVKKFAGRSHYSEDEDYRFKHEASELDARLLQYVNANVAGQVDKLYVRVI